MPREQHFFTLGNVKILTWIIGRRCKNMPKVIEAECVACGACVDVCPQDAIVMEDVAVIIQDKCVDCSACVDECPSDAIVE